MSPSKVIIGRCNRAFFAAAVAAELMGGAFEDAAYAAQHKPTAFGFEHEGYAGRMLIDATELRGQESFLNDFHKAVSEVARSVSTAVDGELNDRAIVGAGEYRFEFQITGYWTGKSPDDGVVEDPASLPQGENLGREVSLKISYEV